MCNELHLRMKVNDYSRERFSQLQIPMTWAEAPSNRPLDRPYKPQNRASVLRPLDPANPAAGLEEVEMRWWLAPFFHKKAVSEWKAMCTNARLEPFDTTAAFREPYKRRRCLVPVSSFIEYDEPPSWKKGDRKRRWEIGGWGPDEPRIFAGLWDSCTPADMPDGLLNFTFVTGPAGPDFSAPRPDTGKPLHARQAHVLTAEQGLEWLARRARKGAAGRFGASGAAGNSRATTRARADLEIGSPLAELLISFQPGGGSERWRPNPTSISADVWYQMARRHRSPLAKSRQAEPLRSAAAPARIGRALMSRA